MGKTYTTLASPPVDSGYLAGTAYSTQTHQKPVAPDRPFYDLKGNKKPKSGIPSVSLPKQATHLKRKFFIFDRRRGMIEVDEKETANKPYTSSYYEGENEIRSERFDSEGKLVGIMLQIFDENNQLKTQAFYKTSLDFKRVNINGTFIEIDDEGKVRKL